MEALTEQREDAARARRTVLKRRKLAGTHRLNDQTKTQQLTIAPLRAAPPSILYNPFTGPENGVRFTRPKGPISAFTERTGRF